eukprot:TRINITY_DN13856_c0_g1_i1.p1 TRINITY_DN13856_c0_g1~~TRINITY_DN13856_c0_g1_i1.p1  ORF type:complete len:732 (-),score=126.08 TRINITY_DN13856_c0_g1_i1:310-2505(-)
MAASESSEEWTESDGDNSGPAPRYWKGAAVGGVFVVALAGCVAAVFLLRSETRSLATSADGPGTERSEELSLNESLEESPVVEKGWSQSRQRGGCAEYGCGTYQKWRSCQCNDHCAKYNSCCADYQAKCVHHPNPAPSPVASPRPHQGRSTIKLSTFYSSKQDATYKFNMAHREVPVSMIEGIWPNMQVHFDEGTGLATAQTVSDYARKVLSGPSPFGGGEGTVKVPAGGDPDQLDWGEYVVYSRRQVCYITAHIVAGNEISNYHNGLSQLIPPLKCDKNIERAGFKRALIGLLAACATDRTMADGQQGPVLIVAKSTTNLDAAPRLDSDKAKGAKLTDAKLRTCRFRDGTSDNPQMSTIEKTPESACNPAQNIDFMRDGNTMRGQAMVDITAAWIGGYILAGGGCGEFGGGQDERLMTFMPEVMVLSFFVSQKASFVSEVGVSLAVPAYIIGARRLFSGFDGTSRDAGPEFNAGRPKINKPMPMRSDLLEIAVNGQTQHISRTSPFLGFQSINQMSGLAQDVPNARLNQNPLQVATEGRYSFENQVAAWYNAVSKKSWHNDIKAVLEQLVVSIGSGPWGSGVWWGSSQVFFLVAWMGQALAADTWEKDLPFDYYIYSSFTENPSNQCLIHNHRECADCLRACDSEGKAYPGPDNRYCCMEPELWVPSPGLFDDKACIPTHYADKVCGQKGMADIYDRFKDMTVAELWSIVKPKLAAIKVDQATVFDSVLS